jgi:hypothetical protein
VTISGTVRNAGQVPRAYVDLVVSAKTFSGATLAERRFDAGTSYRPGESRKFEVDIGQDLWQSYTVRVERYHQQVPTAPISVASGVISQADYLHWARQDLRGGVLIRGGQTAYSHGGLAKVEVRVSPPRYRWATVHVVVVSVAWFIHSRDTGRVQSGVMNVAVAPPDWRTELPFSHPGSFYVSTLQSVAQVHWSLNF